MLTNGRAHGDERKHNLWRRLLLLGRPAALSFRGNTLLSCWRRKAVLENVLHGGKTVLRRCARTGQETNPVSCQGKTAKEEERQEGWLTVGKCREAVHVTIILSECLNLVYETRAVVHTLENRVGELIFKSVIANIHSREERDLAHLVELTYHQPTHYVAPPTPKSEFSQRESTTVTKQIYPPSPSSAQSKILVYQQQRCHQQHISIHTASSIPKTTAPAKKHQHCEQHFQAAAASAK